MPFRSFFVFSKEEINKESSFKTKEHFLGEETASDERT
jgi:hypothetical protein